MKLFSSPEMGVATCTVDWNFYKMIIANRIHIVGALWLGSLLIVRGSPIEAVTNLSTPLKLNLGGRPFGFEAKVDDAFRHLENSSSNPLDRWLVKAAPFHDEPSSSASAFGKMYVRAQDRTTREILMTDNYDSGGWSPVRRRRPAFTDQQYHPWNEMSVQISLQEALDLSQIFRASVKWSCVDMLWRRTNEELQYAFSFEFGSAQVYVGARSGRRKRV